MEFFYVLLMYIKALVLSSYCEYFLAAIDRRNQQFCFVALSY